MLTQPVVQLTESSVQQIRNDEPWLGIQNRSSDTDSDHGHFERQRDALGRQKADRDASQLTAAVVAVTFRLTLTFGGVQVKVGDSQQNGQHHYPACRQRHRRLRRCTTVHEL